MKHNRKTSSSATPTPVICDAGPYSTRNTAKGALITEAGQVVAALVGEMTIDQVRDAVLGGSLLNRDCPVAIINAQDVCSPDDLADPAGSCWIRMSSVSVEGLRQAFLDPASRVRLASDPVPDEHTEFLAMAWQGGFLDESALHFNENLNVLSGGRGTGKSTVVESLRYVLGLDPLGEDARKAHEGILRHVLRNGTKVSLLVRSHRGSKREYLIERTVPNPPVVRDETGEVLTLKPSDVVPQSEVYGQHEISELTKSREKLTRLLERFADRDPNLAGRKADLRRSLERCRGRIMEVRKELNQVEERLASLPAIEETLKRFEDAGLEERLKEQSLIVREQRILKTCPERVTPFRELLEQLNRALPVDRTFLSAKALEGLPGKGALAKAGEVLDRLSKDLDHVARQMAEALDRADEGLATVDMQWRERKKVVQAAYEKILRELQKSKVDGEEFIRLRHQIEELRPLKERHASLGRDEKEHAAERRNLLAEWEDVKATEFRRLENAAKSVSRKLAGRVRVQVTFAGNCEPLFQLLRDQVGGRLSEAFETLQRRDTLSLLELTEACRAGRDTLAHKFGLPPAQAERIASAASQVLMQIEELDLPPTTRIQLNVASEGSPEVWQTLDELSTGQKATAVLLLLLLESESPLVVDQPEDDLDNRFITDGVVPKMRDEKRRRQFIFATHNANILVLGDAELIVGLTASGEAAQGKAKISAEHMGSIDARPVRELVEEVLEGGHILLGVEDDGTVSGLTRDLPAAEQWVMNVCRELVRPAVIPYWETVPWDSSRVVGVMSLPADSPDKPYKAKWGTAWVTFVRVGSTSREATREEEARLYQASGMMRYDIKAVSGTTIQDLDLRRLENYLGDVLQQDSPAADDDRSWEETLLNLDLLMRDRGHVMNTVGSLLLFGNTPNRFLPQSGITATAYTADQKDYTTVDEELIRGPLVPVVSKRGKLVETGVIDRAVDFVSRNMGTEAWIEGGRRRRRKSFPIPAVRETIVNAVAHRDYTITVTDIEVSLYSDRLEVISPGRLPNTVTVPKMMQGYRAARNELLKEILRDHDYVEHRGMGVRRKIIEGMREHNGTKPDLIEEEDRFIVRLWKRRASP